MDAVNLLCLMDLDKHQHVEKGMDNGDCLTEPSWIQSTIFDYLMVTTCFKSQCRKSAKQSQGKSIFS
jgi:hypothetical protein